MKRSSFSFSLATWIACFAIVLATLAPSVSRLIAAERLAHAVAEHCAIAACDTPALTQAHSHEAAASPDDTTPRQTGLHVEHCPFCNTTAASFALLPAGPLLLFGERGSAAPPLPPLVPTVLNAAWNPLQPRGPPVLSRLS